MTPTTWDQCEAQAAHLTVTKPQPTDCDDVSAPSMVPESTPSANLLVNYIPECATDDDLLQRFLPFGRVVSARVMRHLNSRRPAKGDRQRGSNTLRRSKGYGFVLMSTPEEARAAIEGLHGEQWGPKCLSVQLAHEAPHIHTAAACAHATSNATNAAKLGATTTTASSLDDTTSELNGTGSSVTSYSSSSNLLPPARMGSPQSTTSLSRQTSSAQIPATQPAPATSSSASKLLFPASPNGGNAHRTVVLSAVSPSTTIVTIMAYLEQFGTVTSATVAPAQNAVKVSFATAESAKAAALSLNGTTVTKISKAPLVVRVEDATAAPMQSYESCVAASTPPLLSASFDSSQGGLQGTPSRRAVVQPRQHHPMPMSRATPNSGLTSPAWPAAPQATPMSASAQAPAAAAPAKTSPKTSTRRDPYAMPAVHLGPPIAMPVVAAPTMPHRAPAADCPYCERGTTLILQNMPTDPVACHHSLVALLSRYDTLAGWECWGNGQALATFPHRHAALCAVNDLHRSQYLVDLYDCVTGLSHSQVSARRPGAYF